jgi:hypothetical protein
MKRDPIHSTENYVAYMERKAADQASRDFRREGLKRLIDDCRVAKILNTAGFLLPGELNGIFERAHSLDVLPKDGARADLAIVQNRAEVLFGVFSRPNFEFH